MPHFDRDGRNLGVERGETTLHPQIPELSVKE